MSINWKNFDKKTPINFIYTKSKKFSQKTIRNSVYTKLKRLI